MDKKSGRVTTWQEYIMWLEGYCFAAGMGAVLVLLPILGIWSSISGKRKTEKETWKNKKMQK